MQIPFVDEQWTAPAQRRVQRIELGRARVPI
jgi:hypothetical protein